MCIIAARVASAGRVWLVVVRRVHAVAAVYSPESRPGAAAADHWTTSALDGIISRVPQSHLLADSWVSDHDQKRAAYTSCALADGTLPPCCNCNEGAT